GDFKGGGEVDRHHRVPLVTAERLRPGQQGDASAVDQDVDRAQRFDAAADDDARNAGLRDVCRHELHPPSRALDQPAGSPVVLGQADREYVGAGLGQGGGEGSAQAGVSAGDEGVAPDKREQVQAEVGDVHGSATVQGGDGAGCWYLGDQGQAEAPSGSQGATRSRSRRSGARSVAIMSCTESWTSLVSWKHSPADRHLAGPNCCAVATTALARPGSSAASSGSRGQAAPPAAVPRLVICSPSQVQGSAVKAASQNRADGSLPVNCGW